MKSITTGLLLFVALGFPLKVDAEPRFWLHAGINYSTADAVDISGGTTIETTLGDDFSGTEPRFGLGINLAEWLSLEATWSRFGAARGTRTAEIPCSADDFSTNQPCLSAHEVKQSGSAYWLAAAPTWQSDSFALFGKLGISRTAVKTERPGLFTLRRETDTNLLLGAGVAYHFTPSIGVRLDFERMGSVARTVGIGVEYRF